MATRFDATLQMTNSTDALWRAWVQFIEDTIVTTGGMVNTTDTGQMTIATSAHPVAINTIVGYRIYRMADALQATAPIYMKAEYGSGGAANTPRMTLTIGTGTNGAGTITGALVSSAQITASGNGTNACHCFASAATGRVHLLMFVRAAAVDLMVMSLERTKDSAGADTADGVLFAYGNQGPLVFTQYLNATAGAQPPAETGVTAVLSNQTGSSAFGGNVGVGVPLHFKSVVQQPGLGIVIVNSADFVAEAQPSFTFYGAAHTYQLGQHDTAQVAIALGNATFSNRPTTRIGIRYE